MSFIEVGSPGLYIFSKFPIPRTWCCASPYGPRERGYKVKTFIEDLAAPEATAYTGYYGGGVNVSRAISLGAAAVMTPGTELCRREDAERLFESMVSGSEQIHFFGMRG
jgi:hypothetical protein